MRVIFTAVLMTAHLIAGETARETLLETLAGDWIARGVYTATKLEVADHLREGPLSLEELASKCQADSASLERLLRVLSSHGFFTEVKPQVFANNEASSLLAKGSPDSLHHLTLFYGEELHHTMGVLHPAIKDGRTAFELAFEDPPFTYFKNHPERGDLFHKAMKEKSRLVIDSLLNAYDFSRFPKVYDIGGGTGHFIQALLQKEKSLEGVVFDLPEVIEKYRNAPSPRCHWIAGDFFTSIPEGGQLYFLKSILHDWDDAQSVLLLKKCHQAMHASSRLLIVEMILLPNGEAPFADSMDLLMLAVTGGKERTLSSFEKILSEAGFTLERVIPTASEFSILEVKKA